MTENEVLKRIEGLPEEQQKAVVCALVGHSRIQTEFFGYYNCARCGEQVGDTLGSSYPGASDAVIVGHACNVCHENYKKCTWEDKLLAPDPFKAEVEPL